MIFWVSSDLAGINIENRTTTIINQMTLRGINGTFFNNLAGVELVDLVGINYLKSNDTTSHVLLEFYIPSNVQIKWF